MKAVISSTYDDKYLYFLPIVTWCWQKLGVETICFVPQWIYFKEVNLNQWGRHTLATELAESFGCKMYQFDAPEHKEATYAQCSRLYAACLDLPEDEILITSDVDMALFKLPSMEDTGFSVFGADLVPNNQFPICYLSATVREWRKVFHLQYGALSMSDGALPTLETKTYQQCLDELLGNIECDHFRGNYWGKDQETAFDKINKFPHSLCNRTNGQNQFATHRVDRDDFYWEERLNLDVIDAHLWRPGYTEENFPKILKLLRYFYPNENYDWLISYNEQYKNLL